MQVLWPPLRTFRPHGQAREEAHAGGGGVSSPHPDDGEVEDAIFQSFVRNNSTQIRAPIRFRLQATGIFLTLWGMHTNHLNARQNSPKLPPVELAIGFFTNK